MYGKTVITIDSLQKKNEALSPSLETTFIHFHKNFLVGD
jgi:hypothetical protein